MSETKHTPGPWRQHRANAIYAGNATFVADTAFRDHCEPPVTSADVANANARRIVACVNACEGISTDALERWNLGKSLELTALAITEHQRNKLEVQRYELRATLIAIAATNDAYATSGDIARATMAEMARDALARCQ